MSRIINSGGVILRRNQSNRIIARFSFRKPDTSASALSYLYQHQNYSLIASNLSNNSESTQNKQQPLRWYPPHHFIFLPLSFLLGIASAVYASQLPDHRLEWVFITMGFCMIFFLAYMLRQHYALGNQDRIIRLEMRLRYFQLTSNRFEVYEQQLTFGQIAALRFASDIELPGLLQQTIAEQLKPNAIKSRIQNWVPDHMRL